MEYPKKYSSLKKSNTLNSSDEKNKLVLDVEKWANFVIEKTKSELSDYFSVDDKNEIPIGYIWARIIRCSNPSCGCEIPLIKQFWLAKKDSKKVTLFPEILNKKISFKIFGTGYDPIPKKFLPSKGTISKSIITCLNCHHTIPAKETVKIFQENKFFEKIISVIYSIPGKRGKFYRHSNSEDLLKFDASCDLLKEKIVKLQKSGNHNPIPDENLPPQGTLGFRVQRYNIKKWGDLYNSRQNLFNLTLLLYLF